MSIVVPSTGEDDNDALAALRTMGKNWGTECSKKIRVSKKVTGKVIVIIIVESSLLCGGGGEGRDP